jgi:hypothetical protein
MKIVIIFIKERKIDEILFKFFLYFENLNETIGIKIETIVDKPFMIYKIKPKFFFSDNSR